MDAHAAKRYVAGLRANTSLYFPFLVYYRISYYQSSLFPVPELGQLCLSGFSAEVVAAANEESSAALVTLRALMSTALVAADPAGLTPSSGRLIGHLGSSEWLGLDWSELILGSEGSSQRIGSWPLFGALVLLRESVWPPPPRGSCSEASIFADALSSALAKDEVVPVTTSMDFLEETPVAVCGSSGFVLRAAAHLAVADWARQTSASLEGFESVVREALRNAQKLLRTALGRDAGLLPEGFLGLEALAGMSGGSEALWLLDRLQCASEVLVQLPGRRAWRGAENSGMRNDVDISYRLALFPFRELVSDFVRARGVPYCNESILRAVQRLARRLERAKASHVRLVEVGANLGDCIIWA
ncbi:unnamed protein product, partial [Polarella glacialis]